MLDRRIAFRSLPLVLSAAAAGGACLAGDPPKPPAEPAKLDLRVAPEAVGPGGEATVTLRLAPIPGVKINRYPKIKLSVPAREGLVAAAEAAVGNSAPPPPDRLDGNYWDTVDPVELTLHVDAAAAAGEHAVPANLVYFYCVIESGFCAPKRIPVTIPLAVR